MGGVILLLLGLAVGSALGYFVMRRMCQSKMKTEAMNVDELTFTILGAESYDFKRITEVIAGLSGRAQATFIFLYIQAIAKDKRMLGTMRRYLNGVDTEAPKTTALSRPKRPGRG